MTGQLIISDMSKFIISTARERQHKRPTEITLTNSESFILQFTGHFHYKDKYHSNQNNMTK